MTVASSREDRNNEHDRDRARDPSPPASKHSQLGKLASSRKASVESADEEGEIVPGKGEEADGEATAAPPDGTEEPMPKRPRLDNEEENDMIEG